MEKKNGYHILLLEIINNRFIKAFKARLNGKHLEVAGDTGTGKTTATSALWEILSPGSDRITHGEKKSTLKVVLSNGEDTITAVRNYLPSGSNIMVSRHIVDEDGIPETKSISAKEFKGMLSPLSSNPHDIKSMKSRDKVELLLGSAGIPLESYESADSAISLAAVELGDAQAHRKDSVPGDEPEKADPVGAEALAKKIADINEHNAKCDALLSDVAATENAHEVAESNVFVLENNASSYAQSIENHLQIINELKVDIEANKSVLTLSQKSLSKSRDAMKEAKRLSDSLKRIPQEEISNEVEKASRLNEVASIHKQWEDRVEADKIAGDNLSRAQKTHKAALKAKKLIMDGAELPLDGLTINDGELWYNEILVDNLGESEQMLVYGSLAIEDALSHDIRAVRMDGIESMGQEDYIKLRDLATEKKVQLFTTRVTRDDVISNTEILIADGYYPEPEDDQE